MKNIVLFAMSTLNFRNTGSNDFTYRIDGKEIIVQGCISQLEPVSRLVIENYASNEPVELIMLCTKETFENLCSQKGWQITDDQSYEFSAVEYYLHRILAAKGIEEKETDLKLAKIERHLHLATVELAKHGIHCTVIEMDKDEILPPIKEAVETIRKLKEEGDIRLYVGNNGGLRSNFQVLSAIISIMKDEGIELAGNYGVEMGKNRIIDDSMSYDMFDFVSGMKEFLEYGDPSIMREYFKKRNYSIEIDELLSGMEEIQRGLNLCNVNLYKKGLKTLRGIFRDDQEHTSEVYQSVEFQMFKEFFKYDYGDILLGNATDRYVDIIERCVKKKQIQQALTFAESNITDDIFSSGILYFDRNSVPSGQDFNEVLYKIRYNDWDVHPVHFILQSYLQKKYRLKEGVKEQIEDIAKKKEAYYDLLDAVTNNKDLKEVYSIVDTIGLPLQDTELFGNRITDRLRENGCSLTMKTALKQDINHKILASHMLYLCQLLKQLRNTMNHANADEIPNLSSITVALEIFVEYLKTLLDCVNTCNIPNIEVMTNAFITKATELKKQEKQNRKNKNQ